MFEVGGKRERKETSVTGINASWSRIKGSQSLQRGELKRKSVVDHIEFVLAWTAVLLSS